MSLLLPEESELRGDWLLVNGKVVGDDTCRRIESLRSGPDQISTSVDGWHCFTRQFAQSRCRDRANRFV
jgi:hypothetical protein